MHSIIWIGRGERFAAELAAETPDVDVVWECDARAALKLPLHQFDAMVVDCDDGKCALVDLAKLAESPELPPILVRLDAPEPSADRAGS